jgi:predicted esterase
MTMASWTTGGTGPHAGRPVLTAGAAPAAARAALILLHGRGGSAADMLGLGAALVGEDTAVLAPAAAGQTWYPYRFIAPASSNEPHLSSALAVVGALVETLLVSGLAAERIALAGFSQGACLALEWASRHDGPLAAVLGFSGGLIGDSVSAAARPRHDGLPVFLGCAERDAHIPLTRVRETEAILRELGATVEARIYPGADHGINADELAAARRLLGG